MACSMKDSLLIINQMERENGYSKEVMSWKENMNKRRRKMKRKRNKWKMVKKEYPNLNSI